MNLEFVLYEEDHMETPLARSESINDILDAIPMGMPLKWMRVFITDGKNWTEWSLGTVGSCPAITEHLTYCMEMQKAFYER